MSSAKQKVRSVLDEISINRMTEHDLLEVVEIEEESGLSRWGWAAYYAELQSGNPKLLLIALPTKSAILEHRLIAGYIVARETAGELHINNVAVREQYRRRGIGRALLDGVIKEARQLGVTTAFLEVRSGNVAAQALYEQAGFKAIAHRSNYYSEPPEDAVVMSLDLKQIPA
jgi:[ribosomal protein S18]-alanine N-acetyltransferase